MENRNQINLKEHTLAIHNEETIRNEVLENKKFEMLNNEKMTPYFLSLVKGSKKEESLDQVVNDDGTPFNSNEDWNNFIKNTFANLYKIPDDEFELNVDSILNFLGPVAEHPTITEAKLTDNEKNSLETALTIQELDNSIENAKLKSAPGCWWLLELFYKRVLANIQNPSPQAHT